MGGTGIGWAQHRDRRAATQRAPGPDTESESAGARHRKRRGATQRAPEPDTESVGAQHNRRESGRAQHRERRGPTQRAPARTQSSDTESTEARRESSGARQRERRESAGARHRERRAPTRKCQGPTQRAPGPDTESAGRAPGPFSAGAILVNLILYKYIKTSDCMWTLATAVAMAVLFRWRKRTDNQKASVNSSYNHGLVFASHSLTAFVSESTHAPLKSCL